MISKSRQESHTDSSKRLPSVSILPINMNSLGIEYLSSDEDSPIPPSESNNHVLSTVPLDAAPEVSIDVWSQQIASLLQLWY